MILSFSLLDGEVLSFPIEQKTITIGRSKQCDVVLPFEGMSRLHLRMEFGEEGITVTDLNSLNGVLIGGKKIPADTPTSYPTYLNLSFGPITSVQINYEKEALDENIQTQTASDTISELTQTKMLIRTPPPPQAKRPPKATPQQSLPTMEDKLVKFLLALIAVLIVVNFITAK